MRSTVSPARWGSGPPTPPRLPASGSACGTRRPPRHLAAGLRAGASGAAERFRPLGGRRACRRFPSARRALRPGASRARRLAVGLRPGASRARRLAVGLRVGVSGGVRPAVAPGRWAGGPPASLGLRAEGWPAARRLPGSVPRVVCGPVSRGGRGPRGFVRTVGRRRRAGDPAAGAVGAAHRRADVPAPPGLRSSRSAEGRRSPGPPLAVSPARWAGGPSAAPRLRTEGGPAARRFPGSALAVGLRVGASRARRLAVGLRPGALRLRPSTSARRSNAAPRRSLGSAPLSAVLPREYV